MLSLIIYNFFWYLNFNLCILLSHSESANSLLYLDDFGTNLIYFYGSVYGLIICLLNQKKKTLENLEPPSHDAYSTVFTLIGTGFLCATFAVMNTDIITFFGIAENYKMSAGPSNIWFSIIAGVLGVYLGSLTLNLGNVSIRETTMGVIMGAIANGTGAGILQSPGVIIFIAFVAGFLASLIINLIVKRINRLKFVDNQGFLLPILIISFLGAILVTPILFRRQEIERRNDAALYYSMIGQPTIEQESAVFMLAYPFICGAFAAISGIIAGFLLKLTT